jgi:hypothetical protein
MADEWKPRPGDRVYLAGEWDAWVDDPEGLGEDESVVIAVGLRGGGLGYVFVRDAELIVDQRPDGHGMGKLGVFSFDPEIVFRTPGEAYRAAAAEERRWAEKQAALADRLEELAAAADERDRSSGS